MADVREALTPQQESERHEIDRAFREVFATAAGKRVLFWLLSDAAIYASAFSLEAAATNFTLGKQSAGLALIAKLDELDARYYPQLLLAIADMRETDRAAARAAAVNAGDDDELAP
ncbi:MAG TPA: hypothetical protein VIU82_21910 [Bosea sp. (in: a-proteobacteria)]